MPANAQTAHLEADEHPITGFALLALVVGWLVPGAGHLIQKRWVRAALLFICVTVMFWLGLAMRGKVYAFNTGDILDMLGFVGDLGAGAPYMVTRAMAEGQGAIQIATADYGTKYIIVAGLLNVICAVDAFQIAVGKKS